MDAEEALHCLSEIACVHESLTSVAIKSRVYVKGKAGNEGKAYPLNEKMGALVGAFHLASAHVPTLLAALGCVTSQ